MRKGGGGGLFLPRKKQERPRVTGYVKSQREQDKRTGQEKGLKRPHFKRGKKEKPDL